MSHITGFANERILGTEEVSDWAASDRRVDTAIQNQQQEETSGSYRVAEGNLEKR